jgi:hypothetical protein
MAIKGKRQNAAQAAYTNKPELTTDYLLKQAGQVACSSSKAQIGSNYCSNFARHNGRRCK